MLGCICIFLLTLSYIGITGHKCMEYKMKIQKEEITTVPKYFKEILSYMPAKLVNGKQVISSASPLASDELFVEKTEKIKDINAQDDYGWGFLHYAVARNNIFAIDTLLKMGADIELKNKDEETPLFLAVVFEHLDAVKALLEKGANSDERNVLGNHLLYIAEIQKNLELSKMLDIENKKKEIDIYRNIKLERERNFRLKKAFLNPKIMKNIDDELSR